MCSKKQEKDILTDVSVLFIETGICMFITECKTPWIDSVIAMMNVILFIDETMKLLELALRATVICGMPEIFSNLLSCSRGTFNWSELLLSMNHRIIEKMQL